MHARTLRLVCNSSIISAVADFTYETVSYTHLDVYKRQTVMCQHFGNSWYARLIKVH